MSDGILSIGATVDKTGVDAGLESIQEGVQSTVQKIAVEVQQTCTKTRAAWNGLSASVKDDATAVSGAWVKAAQSAKDLTAANLDMRRASILAKDANLDQAESTAILAAAQQRQAKAAATNAEAVAEAKAEEAAAVARAAEEEALSQNAVIASFQRVAMAARESAAEVKEKFIETAEASKLTGAGMSAGFAGLGTLLGAGIAAGFAAHFLDELAKVNVELDHLHVKTGIAITDLAGLQQMVKESGGDWDGIATGLVKLEKALAHLDDPSKELTKAIGDLGLSIDDLRGKNAAEALNVIAAAFQRTADESKVANAAVALFGRGGAALIPILKEQGAHLLENMKRTGALTGVTNESAAAARRWTEDTAKLAMEFKSVMMPVMEHAEDVIAGVAGVFEAAAAVIVSAFEAIGAAIWSTMRLLGNLAHAFYDASRFNFSGAYQDVKDAGASFVEVWNSAFQMIKNNWQEVYSRFTGQDQAFGALKSLSGQDMAAPPPPGVPAPGESEKGGSGGKGGGSGASSGAGESGTADASKGDWRFEQIRQRNRELWADTQEQNRVEGQKAWNALVAQANRIDPSLFAAKMQPVMVGVVHSWQALAQQMTALWGQCFRQLAAGFNQTVSKWIIEGGRFRQMMQQSINQVAIHFIQSALQMTEHWVRQQILQVAQHAAAKTAITATNAAGAAAGVAIQKSADAQTNLGAAKTAAKNTYKVVSGWPVIGPILAPVLAAGAFAAVEAFEQGGIVKGVNGGAVPILAHAGERVLSAQQTNNFEKLVSHTNSAPTSITNHFHDQSNYSAIDGASVSGMVRSHGREWRREMVRQLRLSNR
jgi:hypothetical protein